MGRGGGGAGGVVKSKSARLLGADEADVFEFIQSRAAPAGHAQLAGNTGFARVTGPSAFTGMGTASANAGTGAATTGTFGRLTRKISKRSIHPIPNAPGTTGPSLSLFGTSVGAAGADANVSQTHFAQYQAHSTTAGGTSQGYQRRLDKFEALVDMADARGTLRGNAGGGGGGGAGIAYQRGGSGPSLVSAAGGVHSTAMRNGSMATGTTGKAYKRQSKSLHPLFAIATSSAGVANKGNQGQGSGGRSKRSTSDPLSPDLPSSALPTRHTEHASQQTPTTPSAPLLPVHRPSLPAPPRSSGTPNFPILPPSTPIPASNGTGTASGTTQARSPAQAPASCSPNTRRLRAEKEWRARVQALSAGVRAGRERVTPYPQRSSVILLNEDVASPLAGLGVNVGLADGVKKTGPGGRATAGGRLGRMGGDGAPGRPPRRRQTPSPTPFESGDGVGAADTSIKIRQPAGLATSFGSNSTQSGVSSLGGGDRSVSGSSGMSGMSADSKGSGITFATATSASASAPLSDATCLSIPSLSLSLSPSPSPAFQPNGTTLHAIPLLGDSSIPSTPATPAHLVPSTPMSARWDITLNLSPPSSVMGGATAAEGPDQSHRDTLMYPINRDGGTVPISAVGSASGAPLTPCSPTSVLPIEESAAADSPVPPHAGLSAGPASMRSTDPRQMNNSPLQTPASGPISGAGSNNRSGSAARSRRYKDLPYTSPGKIALSVRTRSRTSSAAGSAGMSASAASLMGRSSDKAPRLASLGALGLGLSPGVESRQKTQQGREKKGQDKGNRVVSAGSDFSMLSVPLTGVTGMTGMTGLSEITGDSGSILLLDALAASPSPPSRTRQSKSPATTSLGHLKTASPGGASSPHAPASPLASKKRSTAPGTLPLAPSGDAEAPGSASKEGREHTGVRPISFAGSTFFSSTAPAPSPASYGGAAARGALLHRPREPQAVKSQGADDGRSEAGAASTAFFSSAYSSEVLGGFENTGAEAIDGASHGVNYAKGAAAHSGWRCGGAGGGEGKHAKDAKLEGLGFGAMPMMQGEGRIYRPDAGVDTGNAKNKMEERERAKTKTKAITKGESDAASTSATAWVEGREVDDAGEVELGQAQLGVRVGSGVEAPAAAAQGGGKMPARVDIAVGRSILKPSAVRDTPFAGHTFAPTVNRHAKAVMPIPAPVPAFAQQPTPETPPSTLAYRSYLEPTPTRTPTAVAVGMGMRMGTGKSSPVEADDEPITPRPSTRTHSRQTHLQLFENESQAHSPLTRYILSASAMSNYTDMYDPKASLAAGQADANGNGQDRSQGWVLKPLPTDNRTALQAATTRHQHDHRQLRGDTTTAQPVRVRTKKQLRKDQAEGDDDEEERYKHPFARGGVAHSPVKVVPKCGTDKARDGDGAISARPRGGIEEDGRRSARTAISIKPVADDTIATSTAKEGTSGLGGDMAKLSIRQAATLPSSRTAGQIIRRDHAHVHARAHSHSHSHAHTHTYTLTRPRDITGARSDLKRQLIGSQTAQIASHAGHRLMAEALLGDRQVSDDLRGHPRQSQTQAHSGAVGAGGAFAGGGVDVAAWQGRRPAKSGMDSSDLARWIQTSAAPAVGQ